MNRHFYIDICISYYLLLWWNTYSLRVTLAHSLELEAELALGSQFLPLKCPPCLHMQKNLYISNQLKTKCPNTWVCREHLLFMPITEIYKWPIQGRGGWYNYINLPPKKKSLQRWPTSGRKIQVKITMMVSKLAQWVKMPATKLDDLSVNPEFPDLTLCHGTCTMIPHTEKLIQQGQM